MHFVTAVPGFPRLYAIISTTDFSQFAGVSINLALFDKTAHSGPLPNPKGGQQAVVSFV